MITIVGDTLSCIPPQEAVQAGIQYLPQIIVFGEETYRDDYEIDSKTFLEKLIKSENLPKTAAPPPALYTPIFQKYGSPGDTIIVVSPPNELSGTFRSATVAAQDFPDSDIRIIDTKILASGLGTLLKQAQNWKNQNMDADQIIRGILEMAARWKVFFVVNTLEYLQKGGRIGAAKALMGSILQVKPILTLNDGHIEAFESQRTKKRAIARLMELVSQDCPHSAEAHLSVLHAGVEDEAKEIAEKLSSMTGGQEVWIVEVPPAIVVHAGPGVIAAGYFQSAPKVL